MNNQKRVGERTALKNTIANRFRSDLLTSYTAEIKQLKENYRYECTDKDRITWQIG